MITMVTAWAHTEPSKLLHSMPPDQINPSPKLSPSPNPNSDDPPQMSWKTPFLLRKAVTPFSSGRTMSSATFGSVFEEETVPSGPHEVVEWGEEPEEEDRWSRMPPELLGEIIRKVEESEDRWPMRKSVVSCACVCRRWREITVGIVRELRGDRVITFPSSLKQPGPKEAPLQCCIKRDRANSTFRLYLSLTHTFMESGKFLLAARRVRHGAFIEYIISLDADDILQSNNAYVGKLCSDFLGTKFTLYDCQPPFFGAKASSNRRSRRFVSKQISPEVSAGNFVIGHVSYKFNFLRSRGPRRMVCNLESPTKETSKEEVWKNSDLQRSTSSPGTIVLKNNAPRWHEHLQCWCLNFHGRVTVASVKNFQLAAADTSQPQAQGDEENVILQFGKIGEDIFSMDYREPLSAFQAFAICLTSFGTKLACE